MRSTQTATTISNQNIEQLSTTISTKMMHRSVLIWALLAAIMYMYCVKGFQFYAENDDDDDDQLGARGSGSSFLMREAKLVVKTSAGEMRVVRGLGSRLQMQRSMHIGFISMDPNSLFLPQYIDSNLILFLHQGEAKIGSVSKDELVERRLSKGDVYRIPSGSAFYILNDRSERLRIICSIDSSESLGADMFQAFSIGGGTFPKSVLAGFSPSTLTSGFNVSMRELEKMMTGQNKGPIISMTHSRSRWVEMREAERLKQLKKAMEMEQLENEFDDWSWSWRKLLTSVFGQVRKPQDKIINKHSEQFMNLYDRKPDFKNDYGWSVAVDQHHYSPLKHSGTGIYLVSLSAGSMLAPHVNPTATEYGIVLSGTGSIQIVFPNGTSALDAKIRPGDVFWVPRYFPFCQIASADEPLEFFGFTTSSHTNKPRFLAGAGSILQTLRGPEMAAAFGVSQETLDSIIDAQTQSVILPVSHHPAPPKNAEAAVA